MVFSERLLSWRRRRGLTQSSLSQKTHIPQPNIAALESGRLEPKLSTIQRLAAGLEISAGTLLDQDPPRAAWNRHQIDALVRNALSTKRVGGTPRPEVMALRLAAAGKLAAAGRGVRAGGRTGERLIKRLRADLGPDLWAAVVRRLDKHL